MTEVKSVRHLFVKTKASKAIVKCTTIRADVPAEDVTEACIVADEKGKYKGIIV